MGSIEGIHHGAGVSFSFDAVLTNGGATRDVASKRLDT